MIDPAFTQIGDGAAQASMRDRAQIIEEGDNDRSPGFFRRSADSAVSYRRASRFSTDKTSSSRRVSRFSTDRTTSTRYSNRRRWARSAEHVIDADLLEYESDSEEEALSDQDDFLMTGTRVEHDPRRNDFISNSAYFKGTVGMMILLNTIVIALEAMYIEYRYVLFDQLELLFTLFYVVEIGWRIWEQGMILFLSTGDWWWSWFDLLITGVSLADVCMGAGSGKSAGASVGRLFRICRILRMFRAMKFMNEVDFVLAHAAKATFRLAIVVALVLFVASIIATNMLWDCPDPIVASMFRDLHESLWSLFKLMTLDDWVPVCERVIKVRPGMIVFFVVFIFVTSIAFISLIPAMFIEVSLRSRQNENTLKQEREQRQHRHQKKRLLRTLFKLTDHNDNRKVSVEEIKTVLANDSYLRQLKDAGLTSPGDLRDVRLGMFELFEEALEESRNADDEFITEETFTDGLLRMREEISPLVVWRSATATRLMLRDLSAYVRKELRDLRSNTHHLENEMKQVIDSARTEIMDAFASSAALHNTSMSSYVVGESPKAYQSPESRQATVRKQTTLGGYPADSAYLGGAMTESIFGRNAPKSREFTFNDTPSGGGGGDPPRARLDEQPAACDDEQASSPDRRNNTVAHLGLSPRQPPARGTGGVGAGLFMRLTKDWGIVPSIP